LTATQGTFSGGEAPVETSNDIQVSDDGISGWKDKTGALTYLLKESDIGKFFRSNSIAIDAVEQELWYESEAIGPVVAARSPITVKTAAHWSNLNDYTEGGTVFAECAHFEGGTEGEVTYRYRWQTRASGNDSWVNGSWKSFTDHALEVESPVLGTGEIKFQCQARDASVDPAEQVNSVTSAESITPLPTTIGTITVKVLDQVFDWQNPTTLTVLLNDDIDIVTTISGDANPTYQYSVRDTNMEYEIKPPESAPGMGNGPDIIYIPTTAGLHTVSINISDKTATDDGDEYPGVPLWVVDAKTWAELQAKK